MFYKVWVWYGAVCVVTRAVVPTPAPAPAAMFPPATSSQSFVLHQHPAPPSPDAAAAQHDHLPFTASSQNGHNQPKYEYKYEVSDQRTGDKKSHWESRDGDRVRGTYTLLEPDGAVRKVEYTADSRRGFNAIVTRSGQVNHSAQRHGISSNTINPEYPGAPAGLASTSLGYPARRPFARPSLMEPNVGHPSVGPGVQDIRSGYNIIHTDVNERNFNY